MEKSAVGIKSGARLIKEALEEEAPSKKKVDYYWTLATGALWGDGKGKRRASPYSVEEHPISFRAYDDDDILYFEGTMPDNEIAWQNTYDALMNSYGVTLLKLYDRKTGKFVDAIG